jgi:DNA-binding MarR family transcriptional regulator
MIDGRRFPRGTLPAPDQGTRPEPHHSTDPAQHHGTRAEPHHSADTAPSQAPGEPCPYVVGEDGLASWTPRHADAWIGLLESHKRLTRALDAELEARHGIGLSTLEVLGRLAAAPRRRMRLSELAAAAGLSLSRVSRIADSLQARGLIQRKSCAGDARAVQAHLTPAGLQLTRAAQATHFSSVQRLFFARVSERELAVLADVFARLAPGAAGACTGSADTGGG